MLDIEIRGTEQLARLNAAMKSADKNMRREINKSIRKTADPLRKKVRENLNTMPQRGGLATQLISETTIQVRRRADSIRMQPRSRRRSVKEARRLEAGRLRHPVFGNREVWVTQSVPPNWFTEPILESVDEFRNDLVKTLDDIANRIASSA